MTGGTPTSAKLSFEDANGGPLANGTLTVYLAGTTTPTPTWQDFARTTLNTNPITLNARGECVAFLNPELNYKFLLKDSTGATIYTQDNILPSQNVAEQLAAFQVIIDSVSSGLDSANRLVWIDDYGTNTVPGTTDMTAAINAAIAAVPNGGVVRGTGVEYLTTSSIAPINRRNITLKDATIVGRHTGNSILSLTQCGYWDLVNITLEGHTSERPASGLLLGNNGTADIGGNHTFDKFNIYGFYNDAGLYSVASNNNLFLNCNILPEGDSIGGLCFSRTDALTASLPSGATINNTFIGCTIGSTSPATTTGVSITGAQVMSGLVFDNCTLVKNAGNSYCIITTDGTDTEHGGIKFKSCQGKIETTSPTNGITIGGTSGLVRGFEADVIFRGVSVIFNHDSTGTLEAPVLRTVAGSGGSPTSTFGNIQNGDLQLHAETSITIESVQSTSIVSEVVPTITNRTSIGGSVVMSNMSPAVSFTGAVATGVTTITRTTNVNITVDAGLGNIVILTNTSNNNWTMLAPTNPTEGQQLTFLIDNLAPAGVIITFTGSAFKYTSPFSMAPGVGRSITFVRTAGLWLEIARTAEYDF